jgi:Rhodopirellula transposase DDE domain
MSRNRATVGMGGGITGIARTTINRGKDDLDMAPLPAGRVRREGGGGKPLIERVTTLLADLKMLVEPATFGDPERALVWFSKSQEKLADALAGKGHEISSNSVAKLLADELGFLRQVNRKAEEGTNHPDRNAQFEHISAAVLAAQATGQPVISVASWNQRFPPSRWSARPRPGAFGAAFPARLTGPRPRAYWRPDSGREPPRALGRPSRKRRATGSRVGHSNSSRSENRRCRRAGP